MTEHKRGRYQTLWPRLESQRSRAPFHAARHFLKPQKKKKGGDTQERWRRWPAKNPAKLRAAAAAVPTFVESENPSMSCFSFFLLSGVTRLSFSFKKMAGLELQLQFCFLGNAN
jgi:hypothetical protein